MEPQAFYEAQAKAIIKNLRLEKELTYKELSRRLESEGLDIDPQVLINRINQGKFSFAFAMQLLAAMGQPTLELPKYRRKDIKARRPKV